MTDEKRKTEPPLRLDMDFGEALSRFVATKPVEVADSIEQSKTKKPPQEDSPRRPARPRRDETGLPGRKRKPNNP